VRFDAAGLRVAAVPHAEGALRAHVLSDLGRAVEEGSVVKRNLYRQVARVEVPGLGALLLKVHRPAGLRDRVRALLRRSRAAAEWEAARWLRGAGVPTPEPLLCGERRRGPLLERATTVARFLEARTTLAPALAALPPRERRALLRRAARWVRAMHDRGISHGDLHSGNVLVGPGGDLHVVDLHRVRVGAPVGRRARERQAAQLLHSLREAVGPGGRLAALLAYDGAEGLAPGRERARRRRRLARVERAVARRERRRLASRAARCETESTLFTGEVGRGRGFRRRDLAPEAIDRALAAHDRALETGGPDVLKDGRRSRVTRAGGVVVKESLQGARHRTGYRNAHALAVRGVPTAAPLARVERDGRRFALYEDLSALPRLDHRVLALARQGRLDRGRRAAWVEASADFLARLHRSGVHHGDAKACNWLVEELPGRAPAFRLVDTDRVRFPRRVSRRARLENLAQLAASVPRCVARTDRLRWWRRYASGTDLAGRAAERAAARDVARLLAKKRVVVDEPIE
jgi:tRNA A-37 threonylcarbamoyl transferase component Bud32